MSPLFNYLDNLVSAIFSTVGAFIPISFLMLGHYFARKSSYRRRKELVKKSIEVSESMIKISDEVIERIYSGLGVTNYSEFIKKIGSNPKTELVDMVNEHLGYKTKNREDILRLVLEERYLESYNLKTYIGNILDRRFPDEDLLKRRKKQ